MNRLDWQWKLLKFNSIEIKRRHSRLLKRKERRLKEDSDYEVNFDTYYSYIVVGINFVLYYMYCDFLYWLTKYTIA